jgi:hypothetical protein
MPGSELLPGFSYTQKLRSKKWLNILLNCIRTNVQLITRHRVLSRLAM